MYRAKAPQSTTRASANKLTGFYYPVGIEEGDFVLLHHACTHTGTHMAQHLLRPCYFLRYPEVWILQKELHIQRGYLSFISELPYAPSQGAGRAASPAPPLSSPPDACNSPWLPLGGHLMRCKRSAAIW